MSHPGLPSAQMPPGDDWVARQLRELGQRVEELSAARSGEATAITGGATVVNDSTGAERVRVGNLGDDVYGVRVTDAAGIVAVLRPPVVGNKGTVQTVPAQTGAVFNATPGASVVVDTPSGRVPIFASVNAAVVGGADRIGISVEVLTEPGGVVVLAPTTSAGGISAFSPAFGEVTTTPFAGMVEVAPGRYTIRLRYTVRGGVDPSNYASVSGSTLVAWPT